VMQVDVLYEDGARAAIPFVWVSRPIEAGFYAFEVPTDRRQPGRLAGALLGLDEHEDVVAHQCLPLAPQRITQSKALRPYCERT